MTTTRRRSRSAKPLARRTRFSSSAALAFALFVAVPAGFGEYVARGLSRAEAGQLPLDATHDSGQNVTAAYEGWFRNADGTVCLLVGYFNRNVKEILDIPIGADNHIDPGGPDQGQPTHFLPRRQWGVFTIPVPADFGDKKLTWTLTAHGKTTAIPMGLNPLYEVEPFREAAQGNTPPVLKFDSKGTSFQGPPRGIAATLTTKVAEPLTLTLWATDDGVTDPDRKAADVPVTISWSQFRGPGPVTFSDPKPKIDNADGRVTTTATFAAPGEYILRAQANDVSGEGGSGFQCCWTNAHVKVIVKASPMSR
jgi:hypothetical protein